MAFIALDGFRTKLTDNLARTDTSFDILAAGYDYLEDKLSNDGDYTYLALTNTAGAYEIIKIVNNDGLFELERGMGETEAITAAKGNCLVFEINSLIVGEIAGSGVSPSVCDIVAEENSAITVDKTSCTYTIGMQWPDCEPQNLNGFEIKIENGCLVVTDTMACNCNLVDGTYNNATFTVQNGRICNVQSGANPQYVTPSCNCCNCSQTQE